MFIQGKPSLALILIGTTIALVNSRPAAAQTVEVTASGVINTVATPPGAFDSSVAVGTPFSVNFFYQLGAPNLITSDPTIGGYYYSGPSNGLEATLGDYTISRNAGTSDVSVFNRSGGSSAYSLQLNSFNSTLTSTNPSAGSLPGQTQFSLGFTDGTGAAANSIALPPASLYQLSNFSAPSSAAQFDIFYYPGPNQLAEVIGTITTLNAQTLPAAVPEASTTVSFGLLLALGLGGVVVAARRKKAAA